MSKHRVEYEDGRKPFHGSFHKCVEDAFHTAAIVMVPEPHLKRRPFGIVFELHGRSPDGESRLFASIKPNT